MSSSTESLFINAFKATNGWSKLNDASDMNNQIQYRCIRLGNQSNCNGEIIKNIFIKKQIEYILTKHEITDYVINEIDNDYEYSFQLKLTESVYQVLKKKMITDDLNSYISNV